MKAPWFPFYTGDFLASAAVQDMEAHEVGAYVLLLARSWQSDTPGYIEDDEYSIRRAGRLSAEQWAHSKNVLLKKWPLSETEGLRYNPRLLKEAGKQVELREKKAEAGRLSAERRAALATERQQKGNTIPTGVDQNPTGVDQNGNYSQPQPQPHSSKEEDKKHSSAGEQVSATPSPESKTPKRPTGAAPEYTHDEAPCFQATAFFALLDQLGMGPLNKALYLLKIQRGADEAVQTKKRDALATDAKWVRFIETWIENDAKNDRLLRPPLAATTGSGSGSQYAGPNPALQVLTASTDYSPAGIAARNVTKY